MSTTTIYPVLEKRLKETRDPLSCTDLIDDPDVKRYTKDANRLSDYLGHMWRRGLLARYPASRGMGSMARWAYKWKDEQRAAPPPVFAPRGETLLPVLDRPEIRITESGKQIIIALPALKITIETR